MAAAKRPKIESETCILCQTPIAHDCPHIIAVCTAAPPTKSPAAHPCPVTPLSGFARLLHEHPGTDWVLKTSAGNDHYAPIATSESMVIAIPFNATIKAASLAVRPAPSRFKLPNHYRSTPWIKAEDVGETPCWAIKKRARGVYNAGSYATVELISAASTPKLTFPAGAATNPIQHDMLPAQVRDFDEWIAAFEAAPEQNQEAKGACWYIATPWGLARWTWAFAGLGQYDHPKGPTAANPAQTITVLVINPDGSSHATPYRLTGSAKPALIMKCRLPLNHTPERRAEPAANRLVADGHRTWRLCHVCGYDSKSTRRCTVQGNCQCTPALALIRPDTPQHAPFTAASDAPLAKEKTLADIFRSDSSGSESHEDNDNDPLAEIFGSDTGSESDEPDDDNDPDVDPIGRPRLTHVTRGATPRELRRLRRSIRSNLQ